MPCSTKSCRACWLVPSAPPVSRVRHRWSRSGGSGPVCSSSWGWRCSWLPPERSARLVQLGIGKELQGLSLAQGFAGCRTTDPGGQLVGYRIALGIQGVAEAAGHAFTVRCVVQRPHLDGVHGATGRAYRPGDELFLDLRLVHAACSSSPLWRSNASMLGSRPRKSTNSCMASREPPRARIASRKARPVSGLSTPCSSNSEKASAESTSAHL